MPTVAEQAVPTQAPADVISIDRRLRDRATARDWIRLARPQQWVKNAFALAPLLFSGHAFQLQAQLAALGAFATFCLLASAIYLGNDIVDAAADRAHPVKRNRPIAAGRIPATAAAWAAGGLLAAAFALAWRVGPGLAAVAVSYFLLNVLYSLRLKQVVILDVFVVASFFILRLLAGATAIGVTPSVWLLLCGGLLALYLGFTKRRHELMLLGDDGAAHRAVLSHYSAGRPPSRRAPRPGALNGPAGRRRRGSRRWPASSRMQRTVRYMQNVVVPGPRAAGTASSAHGPRGAIDPAQGAGSC
jgi:hypothetical protein